MFGSKKRKAKAAALEITRGQIAAATVHQEIPNGFWEEPYVLGVIFGTAGTVATLASGNSLGKEDKGSIMQDVLLEVSGRSGLDLPRQMANYMQSQNPEFMQAAERTTRLALMTNGRKIIGDDDEIRVARGRALGARALNASLGSSLDETQSVLVELQTMWVSDPLRACFRDNTPPDIDKLFGR